MQRFANPNLEQRGLVEGGYIGIAYMAFEGGRTSDVLRLVSRAASKAIVRPSASVDGDPQPAGPRLLTDDGTQY